MSSRRSPLDKRIPIRTRILVETPAEPVVLNTVNLGLGGSYCNSDVALTMGSKVSCKIWLRGVGRPGAVSVEALVLRSQLTGDGYRIALRFTKMDKATRDILKEFLARERQKEG